MAETVIIFLNQYTVPSQVSGIQEHSREEIAI
jgi:hypothetical protein